MNLFVYGTLLHPTLVWDSWQINFTPINVGIVKNYKLDFFHGLPTIVPEDEFYVYGAVLDIPDEYESYLDMYEGYPSFYEKVKVEVIIDEIDTSSYFEDTMTSNIILATTYMMKEFHRTDKRINSESIGFIAQGYNHHGLPLKALEWACLRQLGLRT